MANRLIMASSRVVVKMLKKDAFFESYQKKLSGNLYALLCERENNGTWKEFLDSIMIEFIGLEEELDSINYWRLRAKIGSLRYLSYFYFRSTILSCISIINNSGLID